MTCQPTAAELAQLQADAAAIVCNLACTIKRPTTSKGPTGETLESIATISPTGLLVGMAQPTAGQLQNYDYLIGSLAAWQLHFPVGTDVETWDICVVAGQTLTVQVVLDPQSYQALRTVLATEVKQQ